MPPRPLNPARVATKLAASTGPTSNSNAAPASPTARAFKVLQSSRAPAQMSLGLRRAG